MTRRRGSLISIGFIAMLALALAVAWVGYEPMVLQRMGEDRAADQRCANAIRNGAPSFRWQQTAGADGASLEYVIAVQNSSNGPCFARYEVLATAPGATKLLEGGLAISGGRTSEIVLQLGRYNSADHAAGRVPRPEELKVWGTGVPPGQQIAR
jgi:hypothetical protein